MQSVASADGIHIPRLQHPATLSYRAGQFSFVRIDAPGLPSQEHPSSFLSAPDEQAVSFAIRALGDETSRLGSLGPMARARLSLNAWPIRPYRSRRC